MMKIGGCDWLRIMSSDRLCINGSFLLILLACQGVVFFFRYSSHFLAKNEIRSPVNFALLPTSSLINWKQATDFRLVLNTTNDGIMQNHSVLDLVLASVWFKTQKEVKPNFRRQVLCPSAGEREGQTIFHLDPIDKVIVIYLQVCDLLMRRIQFLQTLMLTLDIFAFLQNSRYIKFLCKVSQTRLPRGSCLNLLNRITQIVARTTNF